MNPFLPLGSLPAHIEHPVLESAEVKSGFRDARRPIPRSQHILVGGSEVAVENAVEVVEETTKCASVLRSRATQDHPLCQIIMQGIFVSPLDRGLHPLITPEVFEGAQVVDGELLVRPQVFALFEKR